MIGRLVLAAAGLLLPAAASAQRAAEPIGSAMATAMFHCQMHTHHLALFTDTTEQLADLRLIRTDPPATMKARPVVPQIEVRYFRVPSLTGEVWAEAYANGLCRATGSGAPLASFEPALVELRGWKRDTAPVQAPMLWNYRARYSDTVEMVATGRGWNLPEPRKGVLTVIFKKVPTGTPAN